MAEKVDEGSLWKVGGASSVQNDEDDEAPMELDIELGEEFEEELKGGDVLQKVKNKGGVGVGKADINTEDGECSSLSDSIEDGMDVDTGILADVESSPVSKTYTRPKFQRSLSKFATESQSDGLPDVVQQAETERGPRQYPNPFILETSEEGRKRAERAKRFHDSPYKFEQTVVNAVVGEKELPLSGVLQDQELLSLYKSSGLFTEDWCEPSFANVGPQYRLDSVLIRGINKMSTEEIFAYLFEIGLVPQAMEWVNDACCIAVYKDKQEAAASLLKVTKPISVDHEGVEKKKNLEIDLEKQVPEDGDLHEQKKIEELNEQALDYDGVSIVPHDKVTVPMPLGHVWRYAKPCNKATGILMRFATLQDRKQERAERYSEYYKKHGNPNNPNYRQHQEGGPRRKKMFKRARYNPSPAISSSEEDVREGQKFNVWTKLSADWHNEEDNSRGNSYKHRRDSNSTVRANTPIPSCDVESSPYFSRAIHTERVHSEEDDGSCSKPAPIFKRRSVFDKLDKTRKRGWEDDRNERQFFTAGHNSDEEWTSRLKGPTMRMHADVEESRQKLQASRKKNPQLKPSISSRLGGRVDFDDDESPIPPRRSVKDRLGTRQPLFRSRDTEFDAGDDYDEGVAQDDDESLQSSLARDK